jgi:molecular chaperone DnaK (HSP70)
MNLILNSIESVLENVLPRNQVSTSGPSPTPTQFLERYENLLGIDLGTEYCCVAVYRLPLYLHRERCGNCAQCSNSTAYKFEKPKIVPNRQRNSITPSYIAFTSSGRLFGEEAKEQTHLNPENTVFDLKRIIGLPYDDANFHFDRDEDTLWPFKIVSSNGKPKIEVLESGETKFFPPEVITSFLLKYLKETAQVFSRGEEICKAVVSVPVYFNNLQRQITIDACKMAGLEVTSLICETTAASLAVFLNGLYTMTPIIDYRTIIKNSLVLNIGAGNLILVFKRLNLAT